MKWKITGFALLILMLAGASLAHAEAAQEWKIDKAHTNIYFDVKHTFATVRGQFGNFTGTLRFNPEDKEASGLDMRVHAASINTNITKRDNHLRSDDFFAVEKYPYITFNSTGVRHVKDDSYVITGILSLKDVTKRIEVPVTFFGIQGNPMEEGQKVAGFEAEFTIDRMEYNVGTGQFLEMGVVGRNVHIIVTMEALTDK
ncbi:MAG: YceI family protein [Desulfobacteraceae bacterium]|nr:YceI family protein [Desulfobacteraceae bacterium]